MKHLHFKTIQCVAEVQRILAAKTDGVEPIQKIQQVLASVGVSLEAKVAYVVCYDSGFTECELVCEWNPDGAPPLPLGVRGAADFIEEFFQNQTQTKAFIEPLIFEGRWLASLALSLPDDSEDEHAPEVLRLLSLTGSLLAPFLHSNLEAIRAEAPSVVKKLTLSGKHASKSAADVHALIVEDNRMNQFVMKKIVEQCGAVAHVVETGKECVEICQQIRFDVIFMDLNMPMMDGFDATRQVVTSCPLNEFTPIIAVTANTTDGIERRCKKIGMRQYISKPIQVKQIIEVMDAL